MRLFEIHSSPNTRLFVVLVICLGLFSVLIVGLAWRQLVKKADYQAQEKRQSQRRVLWPGPRGNIFDRNGTLLVGNRPRYSAVIHLSELRSEFREAYITHMRRMRQSGLSRSRHTIQQEARAAVIQRYLDSINAVLNRQETVQMQALERHFSWQLLLPFPLIQDLTLEEYAQLTEQLPVDSPIQIHAESIRYYPYGATAAHTLGYVISTEKISTEGIPGSELKTFKLKGKTGRAGLERYFDLDLEGKTGGQIWIVDPVGFQYDKPIAETVPRRGDNLSISLDIDLQIASEKALGDKTGAVVAIEIPTDEILVLVSNPSYNLNDFSPFLSHTVLEDINRRGAWVNRATQGLYPPGSLFKIIVALAALRHQTINAQETLNCEGRYTVGHRSFSCHYSFGHGEVNLTEALKQSCNVYFYKLGLRTGIKVISAEARRFGLDLPTGIELPFEARGMIVPDSEWKARRFRERWRPGDTANVSIGQGFLLVTPLQMACFMAALGRGEYRSVPTLMRRSRPSRVPSPMDLPQEKQTLLIDALQQVITEGTGRSAYISGIPIAGKTGTAQVRSKGQKLTLGWCIAFAPVDDPKIALCILVEGVDANHEYTGGATAAPIARVIFSQYFSR